MPPPVSTLTLGGTDISAYVTEEGGPSIKWGRGASFDGSQEAPGYLVAVVQNPDRRFNPLNAGSPYASLLKFGKRLHLSAVHSSTTYHLFDGYLRHIYCRDDGFAELHAQDALYNVGRKETSLAGSFARSISGFRSAILNDVGITTLNLATAGGEAMVGYTGADHLNALDLLTELNRATGTVHYINPIAGGFEYTTVDRTTFEGLASSEDWLDTDLASPFAEQLGNTDYADERIVNDQRVKAMPREKQDSAELWHRRRWTVNASATEVLWAEWDDPVVSASISYTTIAGSPTVTMTVFGSSAKIQVTAGAAAVDIRDVTIRGVTAAEAETHTRQYEDATSISTYGRFRGDLIESAYISSEAHAIGLASYIVWRNKDANLVPAPVFVNRFPTQLARDLGDVVRITSAELSTTLARFVIRALETTITGSAHEWRTAYSLEALPAALDLFTVGGTAGQGVGGTGILAY